ncbi:hypothetical protein Iz_60 [Brucella phage Iz]|nr:hypothetical protein Iz_60 [Brucella phage Iz]
MKSNIFPFCTTRHNVYSQWLIPKIPIDPMLLGSIKLLKLLRNLQLSLDPKKFGIRVI